MPGVRPRILIDDITLVGEVARADPRFRAALAKRGIADFENVQVDPWSAGTWGLPDEEGRRLCHTFCWYRSEKNDNPYAHPIEGLCAVVDLDRAEVLRIDDHGAADVPREDRNYAARYRTVYRDDVKPLEIVQSAGPSFTVEGNEVRWQKWRLRVGFNAREGLVLHAIGYEDWWPAAGRCSIARPCRRWSCPTVIRAAGISARTPSMSASTASACWPTR